MEEKKDFDITQQRLVPKHVKLTEEEKQALLKKYNINLKQLPVMLDKDPMAKLINAKPGDVIKILRKSPTVKESVFYRVVING